MKWMWERPGAVDKDKGRLYRAELPGRPEKRQEEEAMEVEVEAKGVGRCKRMFCSKARRWWAKGRRSRGLGW